MMRRRIDTAIIGAVVVAMALSLPSVGFIATNLRYGGTFWNPASGMSVADVYRFLFEPLGTATLGAVIAAVVATQLISRWRVGPARGASVTLWEASALAVITVLPAIELMTARVVANAFVPRYALNAVMAPSLVIPLLVWNRFDSRRIGAAILTAFLTITFVQSIAGSLVSARPRFMDPVQSRPQLQALALEHPAVVVTGALTFLQFWYYAPPEVRTHLWFIADPDRARTYTRSDSIDREYLAFSRWAAVNVADYRTFMDRHPAFVVYAAGSGWVLAQMKDEKLPLRRIGSELGAPISELDGHR